MAIHGCHLVNSLAMDCTGEGLPQARSWASQAVAIAVTADDIDRVNAAEREQSRAWGQAPEK
jgi:hypothetical protein